MALIVNGMTYTPKDWTGFHVVDSDSENKNDPLAGKALIEFRIRAHDIEVEDIELNRTYFSEEIEEQVKRSVENKNWFCEIGMLTTKIEGMRCIIPDHNEIGMLTREYSCEIYGRTLKKPSNLRLHIYQSRS